MGNIVESSQKSVLVEDTNILRLLKYSELHLLSWPLTIY